MSYFSAVSPLLVYGYLRFFARPELLYLLGPNGDYWFEVIFCGLALALHWKKIKFLFDKKLIKKFLISLGAGFLTLLGAKLMGFVIPFEVSQLSAVLLLVLWGPLLEEFLFRFALYWPLSLGFNQKVAAIVTSVFFSYCHFHAYFLVPEVLKSFVIYQTLYTLFIAFWWVKEYQAEQNLLAPIGMHIFYSFGFYLGMILIVI